MPRSNRHARSTEPHALATPGSNDSLRGVTRTEVVFGREALLAILRSDSFDPGVASACGAVLRAWRLERGIAQDAFALVAGIDRSYYGKLERGERQPSLSVLLKCAAAFTQPAAKLVEAIEHELRQIRSPGVRSSPSGVA